MTQRALFLDRDGVINHEVGYLHRPEDVHFLAGIFDLCRTAQSLGYALIVVTNQSGIARGLYSSADFERLMQWMSQRFAEQGIALTAVYHCPYHPTHGIGEYKRESEDRKPSPGMILRAARDHQLDLAESLLIGDRCSDIAAANAAGLAHAFLLAGTEAAPCPGPHTKIENLAEARTWLKQNTHLPG